jgi:hypothetical protein
VKLQSGCTRLLAARCDNPPANLHLSSHLFALVYKLQPEKAVFAFSGSQVSAERCNLASGKP